MRALALSVFTQCRRMLTHSSNVKALTGFGTAAMTDLFLKNKDVSKSKEAPPPPPTEIMGVIEQHLFLL